jgi:tRNA-dihydrouridine synthase
MENKIAFKPGSLMFAPMEGITDERYRLAIYRTCPEWDYFYTDFLRCPTVGYFTDKKVLDHYGEKVYGLDELRNKTVYQILTTTKAYTEPIVKQIAKLDVNQLDLNLGCPSKTVNNHGGGSYLLQDLKSLKVVIQKIRQNYPHHFSVKMRIGYRDDNNFIEALKLLEGEGVDSITLHARTRDQLYKGVADWKYLEQASNTVSIPLVGNGDIWSVHDIKNVLEDCGCHSVMIARGALKTPWLASLYKKYQGRLNEVTDELLLQERIERLPIYFQNLEEEYRKFTDDEQIILKRFKAFSRYLFDDFEDGAKLKSTFLRTKELEAFKESLSQLKH